MTNFVEVLKLCETAADPKKKIDKPKLAIRTALAKADDMAIRLLREAMDSYRVFGVRKFDQPTQFAAQDPSDINFVFDTLNKLCDRELTGNASVKINLVIKNSMPALLMSIVAGRTSLTSISKDPTA